MKASKRYSAGCSTELGVLPCNRSITKSDIPSLCRWEANNRLQYFIFILIPRRRHVSLIAFQVGVVLQSKEVIGCKLSGVINEMKAFFVVLRNISGNLKCSNVWVSGL